LNCNSDQLAESLGQTEREAKRIKASTLKRPTQERIQSGRSIWPAF